jgi:hypothetical protein
MQLSILCVGVPPRMWSKVYLASCFCGVHTKTDEVQPVRVSRSEQKNAGNNEL